MMIKLIDILSENIESQLNESFVFPIGNDNFNVGYDEATLGRNKILDKNLAIHNSDYGSGDAKHQKRGGHKGIDIFAPKGTPLVACTNGKIVKIGYTKTGGNRVTIEDNNGISYYYAHMDNINPSLKKGDLVSSGDFLGTVGDSGNAKGTHPHLHFSIYDRRGYNRGNIDPWPMLQKTMGGISKINTLGPKMLDNKEIQDILTDFNFNNLPKDIKIFDILKNQDNRDLISRGSKGEGVKEFQEILVNLGYDLGEYGLNKDGIDGKFGPKTKEAVKQFQKDQGLKVDGIIGIETATALSQYL